MSLDTQSMEPLIGVVLDGAYRIERLLGEGGMGAVYAATQLRLDKTVAVKVIGRELADNPEALARFHREAVVTSGLGHPHIVQVFDFSKTPSGAPFLVMEFLEGEDLDHRLRRAGRLSAAKVAHIIKQVASALAATHAKTIVHRDLKPGNIYLLEAAGETDFVKVLDFGISKVLAATTHLTRATAVVGTPDYMSPEQAEGKVDEIDARTDQWSLACIAWECLSGERPFAGESVPSLLFQVVHRPPPALLPKVAGLHPRVEDVLLRALAKNKNDRFADVNDFAAALEDAVTGTASVALSNVPRTVQVADTAPSTGLPRSTTLTQSAGELEAAPEAPDDTENPPPRPKWIWAMAAVAVVLLLGAFLLLRPGPAPRPVSASSPPAAPTPPVPVPPAPPPKAEPPAPARVEPGEQEAKPEPAAAPPKVVPSTSAASPKAKKSRRAPNKKTSEENQDIWRVE